MKRMFVMIFMLLLSVAIFASVVDEINDPSAYSKAMAGAIYALYTGPQSIAYNPAGMANGKSSIFFSHIEHFLGVIRSEFLSSSFKFKNFYGGGAIQYTRPTDQFGYDQYKLTGSVAYKMGENAFGMSLNGWFGSDIKSGVSVDFGSIIKYGKLNLAAVVKNAFASITWASSPSTTQTYTPELIVGGSYFSKKYTLNSYLNFTSGELGLGAEISVTSFLSLLGGYRMTFYKALSKEVSVGMRMRYPSLNITVAYVFENSLKFGDLLNPFYVSLTYNFSGGI